MDISPWRRFETCVSRYQGDYKIKEFFCSEHFWARFLELGCQLLFPLSYNPFCLTRVPLHGGHIPDP